MKLKKRKIKYSAIFLFCWFAFLVFLVDGVLKFQRLLRIGRGCVAAIDHSTDMCSLQIYKRKIVTINTSECNFFLSIYV